MPDLPPCHLILPSPFGEAIFIVTLTESGAVDSIAPPLAGLPPSARKLTYGRQWAEAEQYFKDLLPTLPYRIEAALQLDDPNWVMGPLLTHIRKYGNGLITTGDFWAMHPEWKGLFGFEDEAINAALRRIQRLPRGSALKELAIRLEPYLISLIPTAAHRTVTLIYGTLGTFGTGSARVFLLGELESPGRHPFTEYILRGLRAYHDENTFDRIAAVYRDGKIATEDLTVYIQGVSRFPRALAVPELLSILEDHPREAKAIAAALYDAGESKKETARALSQRFDSVTDYGAVHILTQAINELGAADNGIDLARLNAKMDAPAYLELPPVNWPQQLEGGWRDLLRITPLEEAIGITTQYLLRPEPRLQRNAVLQLKLLLSASPAIISLPESTEARLRQLLDSPYDKIYVEVLNILGIDKLKLEDRSAMLQAMVDVGVRSSYRTVVLRAFKRTGPRAEDRELTGKLLQQRILNSEDGVVLEQIAALLPYMAKYLGSVDELRKLLSKRRERLGE